MTILECRSCRTTLLGIVLALAGCSGDGPPGESQRPHILLFSIDTLRADHLGCYGYRRDTSPRIDAFARSATHFRAAFAPAPWTLTSHVEMLTGRHPYRIGVTNKESSIPAQVPLVTELLSAAGYESVALVDSSPRGYVGGKRGFARGFDSYRHAPHRDGLMFEYDMQVTLDTAIDWLRNRKESDQPFFLFLHTKSVHTVKDDTPRADHRIPPYDVPGPQRFRFLSEEDARFNWSSQDLGEGGSYLTGLNRLLSRGEMRPGEFTRLEPLLGLYDGGIYYVDERFGRLVRALKEQGLYDSMLIVVTADHGEEFLEHGRFKHSQIHNETLRVPLIVKFPGQDQGRIVEHDVRLADIVPTMLDQAGIPLPKAMEGRALSNETTGTLPHPMIFASHQKPPEPDPDLRQYSLRQGDWTLVYREPSDGKGVTADLYHTAVDFDQRKPVTDQEERSASMLRSIQEWRVGVDAGERIDLDQDTLDHLRALGYVD